LEVTVEHKVLITGARGRLGAACVSAFARAGWHVIAQARGPGASGTNVRFTRVSVADHAALAQDAAGATVVLHAANPVYTNAAWQREAQPMLDHAIAVAKRLNAMLLFPGNVYNFGTTLPAELTEQTPQAANTIKGRVRMAMEHSLQNAAAHGLQSVVLRAGDFFGADNGTWLDQAIVKKIAKGKFIYPGPLNIPHAWAYLPDFAGAFVAAANARSRLPAFSTLHFAGHTLSGQDWVDAITPIAVEQGWLTDGQRLRVGNLPWPLVRAAGLLNPTWRSLAQMQYLWNRPHTLSGHVFAAQIGVAPHTPFAQALRESLDHLGLLRAASPNVQTLAA
jgi:nucleoside-diphosphate-sugar epimerase